METQKNGAFCGVASSVTVLNSLLDHSFKPESSGSKGFQHFDQDNFFNKPKTAEFSSEKQVSSRGMRFSELVNLLNCQEGAHAEGFSKKDMVVQGGIQVFREICKKALCTDDQFLLAYYGRDLVSMEGRGHISPVAAYHEEKDMFLLMDVSRYKYEPGWITAQQLYDGLLENDPVFQQAGGVVVVVRQPNNDKKTSFIPEKRPDMLKVMKGIALGIFALGALTGFVCCKFLF